VGACFAPLLALAGAGCNSAPPKAPAQEPVPQQAAADVPATLSQAPSPPILLQEVGFASPRAALYDSDADVYLVSNTNGAATAADGNGFISRVSPEGALLALKWIDGASGVGLDAPKGMALSGDKLYVADINVIRSFDRKSGEPVGKVELPAARYLEALAFGPDGTLYASDSGLGKVKGKGDELQPTGSDAIYAVDPRGVSRVLAKGTELGQPTGLLAEAAGLWVTNLGGEVYRLAVDGQRAPGVRLPGARLHGLVETELGRLVIACDETSTIYIGKRPAEDGAPAATFTSLISDLPAPGQIAYDRKRRQLLVPQVESNALYIQQIPAG
jgi:glucose/arabinose dehydrogenase